MTVWHWRHKVVHALLGPKPATRTHPIDALAEPVRESLKAYREWVVDHRRDPARHPPRWVDADRRVPPLPLPLIDDQLRDLIGVAGGRQRTRSTVVEDGSAHGPPALSVSPARIDGERSPAGMGGSRRPDE